MCFSLNGLRGRISGRQGVLIYESSTATKLNVRTGFESSAVRRYVQASGRSPLRRLALKITKPGARDTDFRRQRLRRADPEPLCTRERQHWLAQGLKRNYEQRRKDGDSRAANGIGNFVVIVARVKSRKNSNMLKTITLPLLLFALAAAPSRQLTDGTPTEQVKATVNQVLTIIREHPRLEDEQLQRVIAERFDFTEMAQRSLGSRWRKLTRAEQQEFVDVFTKLLKNNYLDQIKAYQDQEVLFTGERRDGDFAVVETRIVPQQGEPIKVDYRLQVSGGEWKVYDVVIENVSLINNYRSQFNRVLARNSFSDLIRRMREKE